MRGRAARFAGCAILTACAILAGCGPPPAPPALPLEPADFSLAGIPAGVDTSEIRLSFGDPDSIATSPNPFDAAIPLVTWIYDGFEVRFADGTPIGFMIHAPGERTARGVTVGDHARTVRQLYGDPSARLDHGWTYVDATAESGLRVIDLVIEDDTVRRIYVGRAIE
jgi:hypothetical protein